jgi:EAL domain-containing protein (putative c-di-GMP-specific phosphodiesterase class I)
LLNKALEVTKIALLTFAKSANIKTIAEFISTKEIDKKMRDMGVDYVQGYLYGEPKSAESYDLV